MYGSLTLWQQCDIIRMVLLISEVFCLSRVLSVSEWVGFKMLPPCVDNCCNFTLCECFLCSLHFNRFAFLLHSLAGQTITKKLKTYTPSLKVSDSCVSLCVSVSHRWCTMIALFGNNRCKMGQFGTPQLHLNVGGKICYHTWYSGRSTLALSYTV